MTTPLRNQYSNLDAISALASDGRHRQAVGGLWDEVGSLQLDFLVANGLRPEHYLLDVGCGSFRCGVKLVPFLEPGHYYGVDLNASLIEAGYGHEIVPAGLADRLPRANLTVNDRFDASGFGRRFDFAIALSVFTHVPFEDIRLCLEKLSPVMRDGGELLATYFELPEHAPPAQPLTHDPGGIVTFTDRDPYHYKPSDLVRACAGLRCELISHVAWNHPRAQRMARFTFGPAPGSAPDLSASNV